MPRLRRITVGDAARRVEWTPDDGYTQSLIGATCSCPLRGRLRANRWTSPRKEAKTFFGSLAHVGISAYYDGLDYEDALDAYVDARLREARVDRDRIFVDHGAARAVLAVYAETCAGELAKPWVFTEQTFDVAIDGYRCRGKIDGGYREHDALKLTEHKTKGRIEEARLLTKLCFDFQSLFYARLASAAYPWIPVSGIVYNVLRRPGLKLLAGDTILDYVHRIEDDVASRVDHYVKRWEITYTDEQMSTFWERTLRKMKYVESMLDGARPWFRNEDACERPFPCEYLEACASESMLGYVQREEIFPELRDNQEEDDHASS